MTDGIIRGSGASRFLRSVPNVRTLYPTYDDMLDALAAGTFPIDLNGINPSGWEQVGDKLDKATLLTDALCSALGLPTTATPTQAMEKLRQMAAERAKIVTGTYTGTDTASQTIRLPFSPKAVMVVREGHFDDYAYNSRTLREGLALPDYPVGGGQIGLQISGSSFIVYNKTVGDYTQSENRYFNTANTIYYYMAFA